MAGIRPFAALAQAPALGRAGLVVEDDRDALEFAKLALRLVHLVAMAKAHAGGHGHARVALGLVDHERHFLDALGGELGQDLDRRHAALDRLSAGHRDEAVVEDLVGDRHVGGDRLADRQHAGMGVGAVADIGEHMLLAGEGLLAEPHRALPAHVRDGGGLQRVHVASPWCGSRCRRARGSLPARGSNDCAGSRRRSRGCARAPGGCRAFSPATSARASAQSGSCSLSALNSTSATSSGDVSPKLGMAGAPCAGSNVAPSKYLPTMRGAFGRAIEDRADLILEQRALLLDHHDEVEPAGEVAHDDRIERPNHADFEQAQAEGGAVVGEAESAERLQQILPGLARRDDADLARPRRRRRCG